MIAENIMLRLEKPLLTRLNNYQAHSAFTQEQIILTALKNYLDELEEDTLDSIKGEQAWKNYIASGKKSTSSDELRKELGL
jgi:hypothetical protein